MLRTVLDGGDRTESKKCVYYSLQGRLTDNYHIV